MRPTTGDRPARLRLSLPRDLPFAVVGAREVALTDAPSTPGR